MEAAYHPLNAYTPFVLSPGLVCCVVHFSSCVSYYPCQTGIHVADTVSVVPLSLSFSPCLSSLSLVGGVANCAPHNFARTRPVLPVSPGPAALTATEKSTAVAPTAGSLSKNFQRF